MSQADAAGSLALLSVQTIILQTLLHSPLQRADELADDLGMHRATIYRHLQQLSATGFLEVIPCGLLGQKSARLYALTPSGVRAIVGGDAIHAVREARRWGADLEGLVERLPRLPARWALRRAVRAVTAAGRQYYTRRYRLSAADVQWQWVSASQHRFTTRRQRDMAAADALLVLRFAPDIGGKQQLSPSVRRGTGERERPPQREAHAIWLLLDPAAGGVAPLVGWLRRLLRYREAPERWRQVGHYEHFPLLLVLCSSPERALLWRAAAERARNRERTAAGLAGVIEIRPAQSEEPWPIAVPGMPALSEPSGESVRWLDLAGGQPTTLEALFALPAPMAALPGGSAAQPLLAMCSSVSSDHQLASGLRTATLSALASANARMGTRGTHAVPGLRTRLMRSLQRRQEKAAGRPSAKKIAQFERGLCCLDLTRSHLLLLAALDAHPGLCIADLAVVLRQMPQTVRVRLRALARLSLVERRLAPPAPLALPRTAMPLSPTAAQDLNEALAFRLTRRGHGLLAALRTIHRGSGGVRVGVWARSTQSDVSPVPPSDALARAPAHTSGLYRFFTLLLVHARARGAAGAPQPLRWWETGGICYRRFQFAGRWYALCPDGMGEYLSDGRRMRFWLEWDTGSMNRRDLRAKFATYLLYTQTPAWRWEGWPALPLLLVITTDYGHERRIRSIIAELAAVDRRVAQKAFSCRTTTLERLRAYGPLAAVWWPIRFNETLENQLWEMETSPGHMTVTPSHPSPTDCVELLAN